MDAVREHLATCAERASTRSPSWPAVLPVLERASRRSSRRPALKDADPGRRCRRPRGSPAPRPRRRAASRGDRDGRRHRADHRDRAAADRGQPASRPPGAPAGRGCCASPRSSRSPCSAAGTCSSRASSNDAERYEQQRRGRPRTAARARRADRGPVRRGWRRRSVRSRRRRRRTARSPGRDADLAPTSGTRSTRRWVIAGDGVPVAARRLPGRVGRHGYARGRRSADRGRDRAGADPGAGPGRDDADSARRLRRHGDRGEPARSGAVSSATAPSRPSARAGRLGLRQRVQWRPRSAPRRPPASAGKRATPADTVTPAAADRRQRGDPVLDALATTIARPIPAPRARTRRRRCARPCRRAGPIRRGRRRPAAGRRRRPR